MTIGELNVRINVNTWQSSQDAAGGIITSIIDTYSVWAKVEDRSGNMFTGEQQREWNYDFKITTRYNKARVLNSNQTISYDGKHLSINEVSYYNEGKRSWAVARCSTTDNLPETDQL